MLHGARQASVWNLTIFVLVLFALYEIAVIVYHQLRIARRRRVLSRLISDGQRLQDTVPTEQNPDELKSWTESVEQWIRVTTATLQSYSAKAASSFNDASIHEQYPTMAPGRTFGMLQARVDNLRSIFERPDLYYY